MTIAWTTITKMPWNSRQSLIGDYGLAIVAFCLSAGLYILTISPTISVGDSPELTASAFTLGIAHPPGYPLFSLLGKVATFFPFGKSVAHKVNLLSASLGGISIVFLYLGILQTIGLIKTGSNSKPETRNSKLDHLSAFFGSLTFAVSPVFWSQAVVAEVYTLNSAFFTGLLWLSLKWMSKVSGFGFRVSSSEKDPSRFTVHDSRLLYLISFLWGLSLSNHHTMIAFGPVFFLFALFCSGTVPILRPRCATSVNRDSPLRLTSHVSRLTFFFLLGLSVYLYLPVRSTQNPFIDWGDTERIGGFMDVILRRQFGLGSRAYSIDRALAQAGYYFSILAEQFTLPGVFLGGIGALLFAKRSTVPFLFTLALFLIHGILTILILNPVPSDLYSMDVMIIPSFAVFALWIGTGILFGYSGVAAIFIRNLTTGKEKVISGIMTSLFVLIPAYLVFANFHMNDQSRNTFARDYARDVFESLESNAVIFVEADLSLFPLWYMQYVEGVRRDVAVLDVDMLMLPWFKGQLREKYPNIEIKVPDVVRHAKGGRFKPLSMEAMESYKVSQAEGMLDGLMERRPVYFSYEFGLPFKEFGERRDIFLNRKGVVFKAAKEFVPHEPLTDSHAVGSIIKEAETKDEEVLFIGRAYIPAMERAASRELTVGHRGGSMELMEGILIIDPNNTDSLNNLAFLYAEEGKNLHKAAAMVKKAISLNPRENVRYLKTLGFIYLKMGEKKKAADTFRDVLKAEPGSNWTRLHLREAEGGQPVLP